eukprot:947538-Prorocentrum_minimum.AAC.3
MLVFLLVLVFVLLALFLLFLRMLFKFTASLSRRMLNLFALQCRWRETRGSQVAFPPKSPVLKRRPNKRNICPRRESRRPLHASHLRLSCGGQ